MVFGCFHSKKLQHGDEPQTRGGRMGGLDVGEKEKQDSGIRCFLLGEVDYFLDGTSRKSFHGSDGYVITTYRLL